MSVNYSNTICYYELQIYLIIICMQATLAPPATGKMLKGLMLCYSVIFFTFYSAAISGYWVFGNNSSSNILKNLMPDKGPTLAPTVVIGLAVIFVLLQLFAIGLVSLTSMIVLEVTWL